MTYLETFLRILFGFQMLFWGLNAFFHWIAIPPSSKEIDAFVSACVETKFIMPTVKFIEIICGFFLIFGVFVGVNLLLLAPLISVISGLHICHNKKPWSILLTTTLPFIILCLLTLSRNIELLKSTF